MYIACINKQCICFKETLNWDELTVKSADGQVPCARAGHCAVGISTRMYIWSGRDGYRKAWKNQVCCKDLWYLEVDKPPAPSRVSLVKAGTHSLEVNWSGSPSVQTYILQIQKYILPPSATNAPPKTSVTQTTAAVPAPTKPIQTIASPLTSPTPQPVTKVATATVAQAVVPKLVSPVVRGMRNSRIKQLLLDARFLFLQCVNPHQK